MSISLKLVNLYKHTIHQPWISSCMFLQMANPRYSKCPHVLSASVGPSSGEADALFTTHHIRARDTELGDGKACPQTEDTERWTQPQDSHFPCPFVLQRQPALLLVARLGCSLWVTCWGMSSQVTQICLETGVPGMKWHWCPWMARTVHICSSAVTVCVHDCWFPSPGLSITSTSCLIKSYLASSGIQVTMLNIAHMHKCTVTGKPPSNSNLWPCMTGSNGTAKPGLTLWLSSRTLCPQPLALLENVQRSWLKATVSFPNSQHFSLNVLYLPQLIVPHICLFNISPYNHEKQWRKLIFLPLSLSGCMWVILWIILYTQSSIVGLWSAVATWRQVDCMLVALTGPLAGLEGEVQCHRVWRFSTPRCVLNKAVWHFVITHA